MADSTIRVRGQKEFLRAVNRADRRSKKEIRDAFKEVGEVVRREWTDRFSDYDERSARGYKTRVRIRGVAVEQSLRKVTGRRGDYAELQQRVGFVVLDDKTAEAERTLERVLDHLAATFI